MFFRYNEKKWFLVINRKVIFYSEIIMPRAKIFRFFSKKQKKEEKEEESKKVVEKVETKGKGRGRKKKLIIREAEEAKEVEEVVKEEKEDVELNKEVDEEMGEVEEIDNTVNWEDRSWAWAAYRPAVIPGYWTDIQIEMQRLKNYRQAGIWTRLSEIEKEDKNLEYIEWLDQEIEKTEDDIVKKRREYIESMPNVHKKQIGNAWYYLFNLENHSITTDYIRPNSYFEEILQYYKNIIAEIRNQGVNMFTMEWNKDFVANLLNRCDNIRRRLIGAQ
jgi:hypothetical protein